MDSKKDSIRMFVSVELPLQLKEKIAALADELPEDAIKPVKAQNMHLTLKFIGEIPFAKLAEIEQKLRAVEFSAFTLSLKGAGVFPSEDYIRVVWVGAENERLNNLAKKVIEALSGIGKKDERGFSAHLTIARVRKKIDALGFLEKHKDEEFGSFEVTSFNLMQSVLEYGKPPKYNVLAEFASRV
jgi:2'-5' RNA ligase